MKLKKWKKIDPITQVKKIIVDKKYLNDKEISSIEERVRKQILECEKFAEESPYPDVSVMYDAVYEEENYPFLNHKLK